MPDRALPRGSGLAAGLLIVAAGIAAPQSVPEPRSGEGAPVVFWQRLGDTTLARLTAEALQANRDVHLAQARVRQARAARSNAALDLFPTVSVAGGYTRQRIPAAAYGTAVPGRGLWDGELRASWELDLFGRVRRNLRAQGALVESADHEVRDMQRVLSAELAAAYFDLRGAQDQLLVARRNAENQRRTLELTRNRLEAGRGTAFDTERAQAQLSTTLASVPTFEARIAAARHRIGVLVGRDPASLGNELTELPAGPSDQPCPWPGMPEVPEEIIAGDVDSLIRSRPDVRAAERRLAAETAFVGAARADYLPRLRVGGTAGFTSTDFDGFGRSGSGRYAIGPVITWPAFNLGRVKAGVDAAKALEAEARARHEQTVLLAREEVRTALVAYAKARERLAQLAEAAGASSRAAELARIRFEGGVADFFEVLDAERVLLAAQDQL
ncbi:MAG TPA: TolC family protein, partial [Gemmatimonadales bacterium]|nr:TolC family protein [Gemmatimonadales bacterium]